MPIANDSYPLKKANPWKPNRGRPSKATLAARRIKEAKGIDEDILAVREAAEHSLEFFINLVSPNRLLGHVHKELLNWWYHPKAKTHQLVLLPRDHQKSALVAYRVAWELTKNPSLRVLYISATSKLAIKQLHFIKNIITSDVYRRYWPEMVNLREADREKWTETEIAVDHPKRKHDEIRDPSIFTAGLTTVITGLHCDIAVLDDVVVASNAKTNDGRDTVKTQVSYLASIGGTDAKIWAVGTRYHPKDQYQVMRDTIVDIYGEDGEIEESYPLYEIFERQVEDRGDGTGAFLWPRTLGPNGQYYGFDRHILARKKAQYESLTDFRSQYYNNPNDVSEATINPEMFQYFDKNRLNQREGSNWHYGARRLNVFAAIDFAFSLGKKSDFTAIVVVGVDQDRNYYVLDICRFKTQMISDYFDQIVRLFTKWQFRKLRAEVTVAQKVVVQDLRDNYIRRYGLALVIDEFRPTRNEGTKHERIEAILQPKYANRQIFHSMGGYTEILEEELVMQKPPHDDVKDALASAIDVAVAPSPASGSYSGGGNGNRNSVSNNMRNQLFHTRFGGYSG